MIDRDVMGKTTAFQWLSARHHQWEQHHAMRFVLLKYALRFQSNLNKVIICHNDVKNSWCWKAAANKELYLHPSHLRNLQKNKWTSGGWEYPSPMSLVYLMSLFLKGCLKPCNSNCYLRVTLFHEVALRDLQHKNTREMLLEFWQIQGESKHGVSGWDMFIL